jgi:hypothetical protein
MRTGGKSIMAWAIAAVLVVDVWALATDAATRTPARSSEEATSALAGNDEQPAPIEPGATTPSTAATTQKAAPAGKPSSSTTTPPAAQAQPATTTTTIFLEGSPGFPLDVEVTPLCAERGDKVTVTMRTRPASATTAAVGFSDNQAYGNYTIGNADDHGLWVWRFSVPDEAPYGKATVIASGADRRPGPDGQPATNGEYANTKRTFEVKKSC